MVNKLDIHEIVTNEVWEYDISLKTDEPDTFTLSITDVDADDNGRPIQSRSEFASGEVSNPDPFDKSKSDTEILLYDHAINERRIALMRAAPELYHAIQHALDDIARGDIAKACGSLSIALTAARTHEEQAHAYYNESHYQARGVGI